MLALIACSTTKAPLYQSPTFDKEKIDQICVFPAVDLRFNEEKQISGLNGLVQRITSNTLEHKNYSYTVVKEEILTKNITEEDIENPGGEWLKKLYPQAGRWILLVALKDAQSKMTFGSTGNAEVSSYLFDKEEGIIIWRDKGIGRVGQGGLIGMAMKPLMLKDAIQTATLSSLVSLPAKEKNKKNKNRRIR